MSSHRDRESEVVELRAEVERLRGELQWIADTPMKWTKSQNDIYWSNVATAMASKAMAALGAGAKDCPCETDQEILSLRENLAEADRAWLVAESKIAELEQKLAEAEREIEVGKERDSVQWELFVKVEKERDELREQLWETEFAARGVEDEFRSELDEVKTVLKAVRLHIALTDSESTLLPMIDAALSQKEDE